MMIVKLPLAFLLFAGLALAETDDANNVLSNGSFESGKQGWGTFCNGGSVELNDEGPEGQTALTFSLREDASERRFSFHCDTDLSQSERYRLKFWARSDAGASVLAVPQEAVPNYGSIGGGSTVKIGPTWQQHSVEFHLKELNTQGRINFLSVDPVPAGKVQFARFVLEPVY